MVAVAHSESNASAFPAQFTRAQVMTAFPGSELRASAKLVLSTLLWWSDPKTASIPPKLRKSRADICAATNLSKSTVIRALRLLERTGWMHRTLPGNQQKARHETTAYVLMVPGSEVSSEVSSRPIDTSAELGQTVLFEPVPPTGVQAGDPTGLSSSTKIIATSSRRAKRAKELTSATDNLAGVSGQNAGSVVAAFIDSYKRTWDSTPIQLIIKRIGRDAKLLLAEGVAFDTVLDAAKELGTTEYANLTTVTHRLVTRRENDPRYQNQSWLKTRTVAPFSSEVGSWDAVGTWGREQAVAPRWDDAGPSNWDAAVRWYAGDDGDDYHSYDGAELDDDEIREACP